MNHFEEKVGVPRTYAYKTEGQPQGFLKTIHVRKHYKVVEKILLWMICNLKWFVKVVYASLAVHSNIITELQNNSRIIKHTKLQYLQSNYLAELIT